MRREIAAGLAKLVGTCVLAFGLAFGALFAFTATLNTPALPTSSASEHTICGYSCTEIAIDFTAAQSDTFLFDAWVEGQSTATFWNCLAVGAAWGTTSFGDCAWLLITEANYSYPIMEFWAHWGDGVSFQFRLPLDTYLGYQAY